MKLYFLSLVDVATIPLHFAAGPPLNVWTHNESTERWLSECLLDDWDQQHDPAVDATEPWWLRSAQQSDRGILVRVEDGAETMTSSAHRITEVLIYAVLCQEPEPCSILPTPPGSSSPGVETDIVAERSGGIIRAVKIHALPLSSCNHLQIDGSEGLHMPPLYDISNVCEARFLRATSKDTPAVLTSPRKRRRISTIFEDATYERKRQMRHGGDRVSKAMAEIDSFITNRELVKRSTFKAVNQNPSGDQMNEDPKKTPREPLSRSSSATSLLGVESSRPSSRRGALTSGKRSSLHRVESIMSTGETSQAPVTNTIEQQNKHALTRIVMTGMRMYGLQQKKKLIKPQLERETEDISLRESSRPLEEEDDYKLIYHHTFKAASFIFRTRIALEIINQEAMRDAVDRLLNLFCNDPLTVYNTSDTFNGKNKSDNGGPPNFFDSASTAAKLAEAQESLYFPLVRKGLPTDIHAGEVSICNTTSTFPIALSDH